MIIDICVSPLEFLIDNLVLVDFLQLIPPSSLQL